MGICKRTTLYLARKKGKAILLLGIFYFVSLLLLICCSVLLGTQQAEKDLRSNIGAAFYIRPYAEMTFKDGVLEEAGTPTVTEQDIKAVLEATGDEVKAYNTEHYGYAKSEQLHFIPGIGDSTESNMGRVTAVRTSEFTDKFLDGEYVLSEGRHIQPEDTNKILISDTLAAENNLSVGDVITLVPAALEQEEDIYKDSITDKSASADVEIVGIYTIETESDEATSPTAGKAVNHILSDSQLLVSLGEQQEGIYEGEISFFIADPLHLDEMLQAVKAISSIDWDNHILRENDFQYEQIAEQLQNLGRLAGCIILISAVLSLAILMLILSMRIRGRVREAGILLAIGKTKVEIIGQFLLELLVLLSAGFLLAFLCFAAVAAPLNQSLFGSLTAESAVAILQTGTGNYLHPNVSYAVALLLCEIVAAMLAVLTTSGMVLSLKPKDILSKMS